MLKSIFLKLRPRLSKPIQIYSDGGNKGRVGSWAFVILKSGKIVLEKSGRVLKTGSTQMEIHAAIEALEQSPRYGSIDLYSDSKILIDAMNFGDIPEAFASEIAKLKSIAESKTIRWHWIKGHSKNTHNQRCDFLCTQARMN